MNRDLIVQKDLLMYVDSTEYAIFLHLDTENSLALSGGVKN